MKEEKTIDYDGLPYWIMEYCAKNQKSGKLTCALYTDDFQYSEWQEILPQEWLDDAIKNGDVIEMHYLVGQGSEFYITLTDDINNLPLIIDWDDAIKLTKLTTFEQAKWYYEKMLSNANPKQKDFLLDNKEKTFFLLGLSTSRYGFVERINLNKLA